MRDSGTQEMHVESTMSVCLSVCVYSNVWECERVRWNEKCETGLSIFKRA
jgi:hypothetical protein